MNIEIAVEISYQIGLNNRVDATFNIDASETYFKRDLNDCVTFLTQSLSGNRNFDIVVTITKRNDSIIELETSKRFIIEDYINGFQERSYKDNQYTEVPSKTFGTEGSARKEMKKAIVKAIKQLQK